MNYFELYPGDYKRDTARLGLIEHGAYLMLMLAYYGEEQALPASLDELYQITAAITPADKAAVRKVAARFFPIADDGLRHQNRIDAEIVKAQRRMEIARQNGKKHRPRTNPAGMPAGYPPDMPADTQRVTQPGEALHTPHATSRNLSSGHALSSTESATAAGRACLLMRDAGCTRTNPSHADLLAGLAEGVTPDVFADFARAAPPGTRNPFAYAIAAARSEHAKGPSLNGATHGNHPHGPRGESAVERVERANREAGFASR